LHLAISLIHSQPHPFFSSFPLIPPFHPFLSSLPFILSSHPFLSSFPLIPPFHPFLSSLPILLSSHPSLSTFPLIPSSHHFLSSFPLMRSSHPILFSFPVIPSSHAWLISPNRIVPGQPSEPFAGKEMVVLPVELSCANLGGTWRTMANLIRPLRVNGVEGNRVCHHPPCSAQIARVAH